MTIINYSQYLQSDQWRQVAKAAKSRDKYKCRICNSPHDLNVHHRTYENLGNEMHHLDDLTTLCRRCHASFHGKGEQVVIPPVPSPVAPCPAIRRHDRFKKIPMPVSMEGDVLLTRQLLRACRTDRGGITNKTIYALTGVHGTASLPKGWFRNLVGQRITSERYQAAVAGKTQYV